MYVEKGIEVDGAEVSTVDEVGAMSIFVHITTLFTGSGNLNHRVKEGHHEGEKLKIFDIGAAWMGTREFTSTTFVDYCMSVGIPVEHPVPHVHTQNGLAKSFSKRLQLIARPLLLKAKLPTSIWGHTVLHAANIIRIRPTFYNQHSPLQQVLVQVPNISHFKIFGSAVYVSIAPPQRSKMGAQRRIARIDIPIQKSDTKELVTESKPCLKHGRPVGAEDVAPRKRKIKKIASEVAHAPEEENTPEVVLSPEEIPVPEDTRLNSHKISINYVHDIKLWNRSKAIIDDIFVYSAVLDFDINCDPEPQSVDECRRRKHWPKWKDTIQTELDSLRKRKVFGPVLQTPIGTTTKVDEVVIYLKTEFEMKDLGRTKYWLGIQVEHLSSGIFIHQSTYTEKVLNIFYIIKSHPLNTPMVFRSLEPDKDPFRPREDDEEVLDPKILYLGAIGALMYLVNNTRPNIAFAVNLLARFSSALMDRHWNGIKHIFHYLRGIIDFELFFLKNSTFQLIRYADAGYFSDPHLANHKLDMCLHITVHPFPGNLRSKLQWQPQQIGYVIHEANRECVWLRSIIKNIR
ncbi:uncharacterized protein LOC141674400 [Apium graveolens]|uniref:uncharacterized protein LOC141674400 n=1 Tax=Apium graveolens TaxID=4045 RepID=UPI003D7BC9EE